jgi:P4 family phage/plasmid primase-like protien
MMKPHDVKLETKATAGLVHVNNGVVALGERKTKLLAHDAKFAFYNSGDITFNERATCPRFLKEFLGTALGKDDIRLLQMYCGSMLLGPNSCHGIMIIRGTPGGGKSTLVSIIEKVIGERNVAYLRTSHLGGRFETSAFLGKRLLVGKDVPGDTLAVSGARMLKSLVGGDLMQAEIKYNPDKQMIRGDFHVMIVSNNKLQIALDGDEEAWRRRLLVVDFKNPKPTKPIPNFAEKLLAKESSGILNWLIEGANAYRAEMDKHGLLKLNEEQQKRVETLIKDSDNVTHFVNQSIVPKIGGDVSTEELLICYHRTCERQKWTPAASQTFRTRVPDLMAQMFKTVRRNDIIREGKSVRGFKGVALA